MTVVSGHVQLLLVENTLHMMKLRLLAWMTIDVLLSSTKDAMIQVNLNCAQPCLWLSIHQMIAFIIKKVTSLWVYVYHNFHFICLKTKILHWCMWHTNFFFFCIGWSSNVPNWEQHEKRENIFLWNVNLNDLNSTLLPNECIKHFNCCNSIPILKVKLAYL